MTLYNEEEGFAGQPLPGLSCVFRPSGDRRTLFGQDAKGDLIHIEDADRGKTGLICPDCGAALVARKGEVNAHHFAHWDAGECIAAGETALHREAKNILIANPELLLPELVVLGDRRLPKQMVKLHAIEIETWEGGFRPDLRATMSIGEVTRTLYIEIRVTHPVDEKKMEKVRAAGHSMVEIDLSAVGRELTRKDLSVLLRRTAPRKWLHHRRMAELATAILEERELQRLLKEEEARLSALRAEQQRKAWETAKNRAPSKATAGDIEAAAQQVLEWQALGRGRFFTLSADDHVFDVPPSVWRASILKIFAPWASSKATRRNNASLAQVAELLLDDIRKAGWIKPEFLRLDPKTRKSHAFFAVFRFLAAVTERDDHYTRVSSGGMDLSGFCRPFQKRYEENLGLLKQVNRIEHLLAVDHGVRLTVVPQGMPPSSNGKEWLAGDVIVGSGTYSISSVLSSLLVVLVTSIKGTERCPDPKDLAGIDLCIIKDGRDVTRQFLAERQEAINQLAQHERNRRIKAELERLMTILAPALNGLEAMGPWPDSLLPNPLPDEEALRTVLGSGPDGPLTGGDAEELQARSKDAEIIIEAITLIWDLTKDLGLEHLMWRLRDILVQHMLEMRPIEPEGKHRLQAFNGKLKDLKPLVASLADVEKHGQYAMERAAPENFALRSLLSRPETGDRNILESAISGDIVTARRLTNLIARPRLKPAWIIKDLPTNH